MTPEAQARRAMIMTLAYDSAAAAIAMWLAIEGRWALEGGGRDTPMYMAPIAAILFAGAATLAFVITGVHRQVWRHSGWPDAFRVVQAAGLALLMFMPAMFVWNRLIGLPRTSIFIALGIWLALLFVGRMAALLRSTRRPFQIFAPVRKDAEIAVVVGDAISVAEGLRALRRTNGGSPLRVLGILETGLANPGRAIRGVTVMGGLDRLGNTLDVLRVRYGATPMVAVAGDARTPVNMGEILEEVSARHGKIMAIGGNGEARLEKVRPADLLARAERALDPAPIVDLVGGRRVFVTGGGGTIGSELARQSAACAPEALTLYDSSEYNLYEIDLELRNSRQGLEIASHLGDVRNEVRLLGAMRKARPDVVIHAAALKQVPLMEENPCEAILTNIGGTILAAKAAVESGAQRLVFISTDKAVNPPNVMGATKRLAELALAEIVRGTQLAVSMVRFGNVLGSSGSVVPLFERQIEAGGPVTVTDPEITRYFMTVEEASRLVLQAAALQTEAGVAGLYVLDMGDPVRIQALAEAMVRLKGFVPGRDIDIVHTGLRPGEKLHEELTYPEEALGRSSVSGVMRVTGASNPPGELFMAELGRLIDAAAASDRETAVSKLSQLVSGLSVGSGEQRALRRLVV